MHLEITNNVVILGVVCKKEPNSYSHSHRSLSNGKDLYGAELKETLFNLF